MVRLATYLSAKRLRQGCRSPRAVRPSEARVKSRRYPARPGSSLKQQTGQPEWHLQSRTVEQQRELLSREPPFRESSYPVQFVLLSPEFRLWRGRRKVSLTGYTVVICVQVV